MGPARRTAVRFFATPLAAALALTALAACGGNDDDGASAADGEALTLYSGRNEELVGPLLAKLEAAAGVPVEIRYAGTAELAAQLLEEGDDTPADVFFSQDAGALGALAKANRLAALPAAVTDRVAEQYRGPDGAWVATSARARVVAYHPEQAPEAAEFTSIDQVLDPKYRGKIAVAPTNASFQSFVTALRVVDGEDGAKQWLEKLVALEPQIMDGNNAILDAVDNGTATLGLINHYYWHQKVAEVGADKVTAKIRFLDADDPGALINVAGAGVLGTSDQQDAAIKAVEFLLSDEAQQYFADETSEYPVVAGVTSTKHQLPDLAELTGASVDLNDLDSLEQTLALLEEVGLS